MPPKSRTKPIGTGLLIVGCALALVVLTASVLAAWGVRRPGWDRKPLSLLALPWVFEARSCDLRYQWKNFRVMVDGRNPYREWLEEYSGPDRVDAAIERIWTDDLAPYTPTYPPSSLLLLAPLLVLPFPVAKAAMLAANLTALNYLAVRLGKALGAPSRARAVAIGGSLLVLGVPGTWYSITQGQFCMIFAAAVVALGRVLATAGRVPGSEQREGPDGNTLADSSGLTRPANHAAILTPLHIRLFLLGLLCTVKPSLFLPVCGVVAATIGWGPAIGVVLFHAAANVGYSLYSYGNPTGVFVDWAAVVAPYLRTTAPLSLVHFLHSALPRHVPGEAGIRLAEGLLTFVPPAATLVLAVAGLVLVRRRPERYMIAAGWCATAAFFFSYRGVYDFVVVAILAVGIASHLRKRAAAHDIGASGSAASAAQPNSALARCECHPATGAAATASLFLPAVYFAWYSAQLAPDWCYAGNGKRLTLLAFALWHVGVLLWSRRRTRQRQK